jgi:structure-specific endonuclease subunit SLX1
MPFFVYLLQSTNNYTYIGATVDLDHRLRQHNKEIKGGAIATSIQCNKGELWSRIVYVSGFPDWKAALQFEWRWKQLGRMIKKAESNMHKRLISLHQLICLDRPTNKAILYSEWPNLPKICWEDYYYELLYNNLIEIKENIL